jgi:hypothetical protein
MAVFLSITAKKFIAIAPRLLFDVCTRKRGDAIVVFAKEHWCIGHRSTFGLK